ncbi:MAG: PAS domain S-box protein, partial [Peptococcaceae bacterium]|nr:PAS domain S-box protein [Peptococcaceae bacterium]
LGENIRVVFIGPCIAKKKEAEFDARISGCVDAVIDFVELESWLNEEGIDMQSCEPSRMNNRNPQINRLYPVTGGILKAVEAAAKNHNYKTLSVHGVDECISLLKTIEKGELNHYLIEMNICRGGCIEGPAIAERNHSRFLKKQMMMDMLEAETSQPKDFPDKPDGYFTRVFEDRSFAAAEPSEEEIREILRKIGKNSPEDELNCMACGYTSCRDKAIAVYQGKAELTMCMPYMQEQARSMARIIMDKSPDAILAVDRDMHIAEFSAAAENCFGISRHDAQKRMLSSIIDDSDFRQVYQSHENIYRKKVYYPQYELYFIQDIIYMEEQDSVLGMFQNITASEIQKKEQYIRKVETIEMAQAVIDKQMMVAHQIASLLGETTAETKVSLTKLRKMILSDQEELEQS